MAGLCESCKEEEATCSVSEVVAADYGWHPDIYMNGMHVCRGCKDEMLDHHATVESATCLQIAIGVIAIIIMVLIGIGYGIYELIMMFF